MGITREADPGPSEMARMCKKKKVGNYKYAYKRDKTCLLSVLGLSGMELGS